MAVDGGALLHENESCLSVETGRGGAMVHTNRDDYRCSLIIGADGFFSRVRRNLLGGFSSDETRFCTMAEVPLSSREIENRFSDLALIHYGYIERGYSWIFPKGDYLSTGIGGAFSHDRTLPDRLRSFLRLHNLPDSVRIRGCFIPVSRMRDRAYGERTMLAGDAAGFVDSFSGEGIRFAIASGKIAAEIAVEAFTRGSFSAQFLSNYQNRCNSSFGDDLKRSNRATDLLFKNPRLLLGAVIRSDEALMGYLKTVTGEWQLGYFLSWLKSRMPAHIIRRLFTPR
jgi:flavin-dependent dehydrogenase